jgi:hypothetical protein
MTGESAGRMVVYERSGGFCEVRIEKAGVCRGMGESVHHRRKRSHGGSWSPSNLVHACGDGTTGCHGYLEANPATARRYGLWLYSGQDALTTPVQLTFRGFRGWWLLDDEGSMTWLSMRALDRMQVSR